MRLIDSHCHLTSAPLAADVEGVLERARRAGVDRLITIGTDAADDAAAVALAQRLAGVYAAVGIHPHEAAQASADDLAQVAGLYAHTRVVAAGEIGLDYHYDFADRPTQKRVFAAQLELARRAEMPVVIHCREAFEDTVAILRECRCVDTPVVFHCFGGSADQFALLDRFGWQASFTGSVTFKNARPLQELVRRYPADRLILETDAPYLTPEPIRRVRPNEPAFLIHVADFLAELRAIPLDELAAQATANTTLFFDLPCD